jgi:hypothetical protein
MMLRTASWLQVGGPREIEQWPAVGVGKLALRRKLPVESWKKRQANSVLPSHRSHSSPNLALGLLVGGFVEGRRGSRFAQALKQCGSECHGRKADGSFPSGEQNGSLKVVGGQAQVNSSGHRDGEFHASSRGPVHTVLSLVRACMVPKRLSS